MAALQFLPPVALAPARLVQWLARWHDVVRAAHDAPTGQDSVRAVTSYILRLTKLDRQRLQILLLQHVGEPTMKKFVSSWDMAVKEGEAKGEARGEAKGQSRTLLRQLRRRFGAVPDAVVTRVETATPEQLDRWCEIILDAKSLDEVFARN